MATLDSCIPPAGGLDALALASYLGAALVVWAYWANSSGRLGSGSWGYRLANLGGALLVLPVTWVNHVWASSLLQLVWAAVALWSIARSWMGRGDRQPEGPAAEPAARAGGQDGSE